MKRFRIDFFLANGEVETERKKFQDWTGRAVQYGKEVGPRMTVTAEDWARDYAESFIDNAGGGVYVITELGVRRDAIQQAAADAVRRRAYAVQKKQYGRRRRNKHTLPSRQKYGVEAHG